MLSLILLLGIQFPLLCLPSVNAQALFHRILPVPVPDHPPIWLPRADIQLSPKLLLAQPVSFKADWLSLSDSSRLTDNALYQIAFQLVPDAPISHVASVKACYLNTARAEHFTLHKDASAFYHVSYAISPIQAGVPCPSSQSRSANFLNTTISVTYPSPPPSVELRAAPALTPQGQPQLPPPEKTFLQKYWIYICMAVGLILFAGGSEDPDAGRGAPASR